MIETRRLTLTPAAPQHLLTLIERPDAFEPSTGLSVAPGLREFYVSGEVSPAWLSALRKSSDPDPWRHGFFIVHRETQSVIGTAGFKGPADDDGMVELAYGVACRTKRLDASAAQERLPALRDGHRSGRRPGLAVGAPPLASALPVVYVEPFNTLGSAIGEGVEPSGGACGPRHRVEVTRTGAPR